MAGCSVEKNTKTTRFYQGVTSRYNIYFNGLESYRQGIARINQGYTEDFTGLLRIFEFSDPATQTICASDMERAVQKASKVISLKSITVKPEEKGNSMPTPQEEAFMARKEYNEWIDDSYLLMGKARLYKRDYDLAKSTLSFNLGLTADEKMKAETTVWLARVYNETGNYNESLRILNELDPSSPGFPKELRPDYFSTRADLFVKQKRYQEAIEPLEKALEHISSKRTKYRFTYILAQLYERSGNGTMATAMYRKVVKLNPPYEFEFNARINMAGVFDINTGNPNLIRRELEKMLKSSKNREFQDQIYFALGNLYMKEGNVTEAIIAYKKSALASTTNRSQRARTFLALAEYFYSRPDYVNAGKYYDSALIFINQNYPDYDLIKAKSQNLNTLVGQLDIIQREDSLQRVAKMTEQERSSLINSIIEKVKEDEKAGRAGDSNTDRYNLGQYYENERRFQGNIDQEGKWYFYNQSALTFGRTEFRRRWGDRKLEDNWRRLNKTRIVTAQPGQGNPEDNGQADTGDTTKAIRDNKKPEYYLRNLPLTDSLVRKSNDRIANAFLESGKIYTEKFQDNGKAIESFNTLIRRYQGEPYEPEALYNIYKIYTAEKKQEAEVYRQKLVEKFPANDFTRIITDPSYYNKKVEIRKESETLYNSAYELFVKEDFKGAIALCEQGMSKYSRDELMPKFLLLRSYCLARTTDERTFKEALSELIKTWPSSAESAKASEIVAYLNNKIPELKVEEDKQIAAELYSPEPESQHTFILIIQNPAFNLNQATFDVISYNIDNYTNKNLRTQGSLVDDKYIMLSVSGFAKTSDAMDYFRAFRTDDIVRNTSGTRTMTFIIGKSNLAAFTKDKDPARYLLFFRDKYLNEELEKKEK